MDKDDIIHERIIAFIEKYNKNKHGYDSHYYVIKRLKPSEIKEMEKMVKINLNNKYNNMGICPFIFHYLIYLKDNNEKEIFHQLVIDILNNNYAHIKYDFTIEMMIDSYLYGKTIIRCLKDYNLLSYLGRIHPTKIKLKYKGQEENAYYMYDEMCDLQMTWIKAVIKAGGLFFAAVAPPCN
jgi:hypothetical protein